jgi:hypothetical protein
MRGNTNNPQKILILTAIPDGLRLDKEIREIESAIRKAVRHDLFEIRIRTAVRPQDIRRALAEERPQIVHYCGHGTSDGCLILEDDTGNRKFIPAQGLAALFKLHTKYVNCVVLNACYSEKPAYEISKHVNYAIGMNQPIGDKTAIVFAVGFYDGLGYDNLDNQDIVQRAYEEGVIAIQMEDLMSGAIPILKRKIDWSADVSNVANSSTLEPIAIYVERPPIEEKCYRTILQPGALIRLKAPQRMGKTLLLEKLLDYARQQGYRTAKLDLKLADNSVLTNLKAFLQWLCVDVSDILELEPKLTDYWQDSMGLNTSCTRYFQKYLLSNIDAPLVFAIDNFERLFKCENIFSEFCLLLRSWYETAKQGDRMGKIWKKLRLVVVNSTEVYPTLDTNRSPFNVGLAIELPEFNKSQAREMAQLYEINGQLGEDGLSQLMGLVGGHPYLVQSAIANIKSQEISLEELLTLAPTEEGIFSHHLRQQLKCLQDDSQLESAYKEVVIANEPVQFNPEITFKLHSLGLVKIHRNDCIPSCDLYRQYFSARLG